MKKICIITNIPSPYRVDFFNYLIENFKEYNFKIIYSSTAEDDRGWNLDFSKIKNSDFLKSKSIIIKKKLDNKYIHFGFGVTRCLKKYNPDVIIGCEYNPISIIAYTWAKLHKKKYISWSDGTLNSEKHINKTQRMLRKIICKKSDAFIASSSKTKEAQVYYGANKEKIKISNLTIDINKYIYEKTFFKGNRLLFVGRLSYTKGIDLLLEALADIECDYMLTIVGDGPDRENLECMVKDMGISDKVNFVGSKSGNELQSIYKDNDIFILPSRCDCYGLVLVEAMCNCMAIISSKFADGSYDLINENGYIINPYNKSEFSNTIRNLILNNEKSKIMGLKSFNMVNKLSFKYTAKEFIEAIKILEI
ncbi:glycosyltransferase [Clostridium perfringens]|uniref:glycosyltransferase n=1 Tax=Clostridium perfringens TaxID=1502 RepID=UPI002AC62A13|nr:glycosyltransferase [Clostridium perfringens]MDZ5129146.1 glycosyltransferase [Clostridium perfringens]